MVIWLLILFVVLLIVLVTKRDKLTNSQVQNLDNAHLEVIPQKLSVAQLNLLVSSQISDLSTTFLNTLVSSQISGLSTTFLNTLVSSQISGLSTTFLNTLASSQSGATTFLKKLTLDQINQVTNITPDATTVTFNDTNMYTMQPNIPVVTVAASNPKTWTCPANVYYIGIAVIGAGGAGAVDLRTSMPTAPVITSIISGGYYIKCNPGGTGTKNSASGGQGSGGTGASGVSNIPSANGQPYTSSSSTGGNGGTCYTITGSKICGGGGGAGGWSGKGGNGESVTNVGGRTPSTVVIGLGGAVGGTSRIITSGIISSGAGGGGGATLNSLSPGTTKSNYTTSTGQGTGGGPGGTGSGTNSYGGSSGTTGTGIGGKYGGGGGGYSAGTTATVSMSGGGGGGTVCINNLSVNPGTVYTIIVSPGGTSGVINGYANGASGAILIKYGIGNTAIN